MNVNVGAIEYCHDDLFVKTISKGRGLLTIDSLGTIDGTDVASGNLMSYLCRNVT